MSFKKYFTRFRENKEISGEKQINVLNASNHEELLKILFFTGYYKALYIGALHPLFM